MLIVNADDLGRCRYATDSALSCYSSKRIASTSAMVFMEDSERAAELALASGIDVGLHINLSEPFSAPNVPPRLIACQNETCRFLRASKYSVVLFHPFLTRQFRYTFDAQHDEFLRLFGRPPSHLDGHHHMHLNTNMLIQRILPVGTAVRRSFSFFPGERGLVNRGYRGLIDAILKRRHQVADYFFALSDHLVVDRFDRVIQLSKHFSVELMTHPQRSREYEFLMSKEYDRAISHVVLGGYGALAKRTRTS